MKGRLFLRCLTAFVEVVELLWRFGGCRRVKWKGKWRSEKWKFLIQGNYSKKACSCERAFLIICESVAIQDGDKYFF